MGVSTVRSSLAILRSLSPSNAFAGGTMRRTVGLLALCSSFALLLAVGLSTQAGQANPTVSATSSPTASANSAGKPDKKILEYTLPAELYGKAQRLGRIRFAVRLFGFFYALFALWFILQTRLSPRFRDWALSATPFRFLQALIYTPLFALT